MFDDGVSNEFEAAHQRGLTRGFDLGWSYKGRFDRQIIRDMIEELQEVPTDSYAINTLDKLLARLKKHEHNREFITGG